MLRKLSLLSCLYLASSPLSASNGFYPYAPAGEAMFSFGLQAYYSNQSNNLPAWVESQFVAPNFTFASPYKTQQKLGNSHGWGYQANLTYLFENHCDDIRLSYFGMRNDGSDTFNDVNTHFEFYTPSATIQLPIGIEPDFGQYSQDYNFDLVDLTLGTYQKLTPCLHARFGYGLSYVYINQHGQGNFQEIDTTTNVVLPDGATTIKSRFQGIGPKFIVDTQFDLRHCFSIVNNVALSLLYGTNQTNSKLVYFQPFTDINSPLKAYYSDTVNKLALGVDSKLGLQYQNRFNCDSSYNIEIGVRGLSYINALREGYGGFESRGGYSQFDFRSDYFTYGYYLAANVNY